QNLAPVNSYPVDLPCQDYDVLCPDSKYLSCLESDTESFCLPSGAEVESVMERVILFLLSQIVFGMLERSLGEHVYFSTHPVSEYGKIFWQDGEAVGFYTVKNKGSLCNGYTAHSYLLPVLDTVFVRSHWRRSGLGMQMLQDFCRSMPTERVLGISYPISPSMFGVCKKYLEIHQEQRDRLYEVEAPGNWSQRRNVWLSILLQHQPTHKA
ncbi:hypothetical protein QTP70_034236, partial [Hemibagrus guttatus]